MPTAVPNFVNEFIGCMWRQCLSRRKRCRFERPRHDGHAYGNNCRTGQSLLNQLATIYDGHGSSLQSWTLRPTADIAAPHQGTRHQAKPAADTG
jgi:hypothetical protein